MNIPGISLRHPQTSLRQPHGISREHKMLTDTNRHRQIPKDTDRCFLSMSGSVPWHLLSSVGMSCSLETSEGCLEGVWGVSGGCLGVSEGYLSGIHRNWRRWDVFGGYVGSQNCFKTELFSWGYICINRICNNRRLIEALFQIIVIARHLLLKRLSPLVFTDYI